MSDLEGKEKHCILNLSDRKIRGAKWSPDGESIFYLSDYDLDIRPPLVTDVKFITRMQYRFDGEGYFNDRRYHLFQMRPELESGNMVRLTSGEFDIQSFDVSPDGKRVAFVSNLDERADFEVSQDVYLLPVDAKKNKIEKITDWKGRIETLAFSPDGLRIAFIGHDYRYKFKHCARRTRHTTWGPEGWKMLLVLYPGPQSTA